MSYKDQLAAVEKAEAECKRFLEAVTLWKEATAEEASHNERFYMHSRFRESAAMKRASMDLTRALVAVRNTPTY